MIVEGARTSLVLCDSFEIYRCARKSLNMIYFQAAFFESMNALLAQPFELQFISRPFICGEACRFDVV